MAIATFQFVPLFVVNYTPSGVLQTATFKAFVNQTDANTFLAATSGATLQPALGVTLFQPGSTALGTVYLLSSIACTVSGTQSYLPTGVP